MCGKGAHIRWTLDLWFDAEGSVQFPDHVCYKHQLLQCLRGDAI
jgi:hypothetical protein